MKNFIFALVFIFLAFLAWQYYSQADFDFKLGNIKFDNFKELNFFKNEETKDKNIYELDDLQINENLTVPKEILACLVGARDNLDQALESSFNKSDDLLSRALLDFNQCEKREMNNIDKCYQDYLERQNQIIETIKLERVNINNAYQFNIQLCWPDVSEQDLELIFNKI